MCHFSENRARVKKGDKYGFIDEKGKVVIPLKYDDCEPHFNETYPDDNQHILPLWVKSGDKYGFIDINGNEHPPVDAELYNAKNECSYVYFDWAEIPNMEVRIEDNLVFSDAGIVAIGIW
ncbi:hypothetical protein FACS189413_19100 [Bacteroidia bacterium]|nr:hypothetical protein FACS189413_19100 [Bacteroidia bacterium]